MSLVLKRGDGFFPVPGSLVSDNTIASADKTAPEIIAPRARVSSGRGFPRSQCRSVLPAQARSGDHSALEKSFINDSNRAGGCLSVSRFSATCSTELIPTSDTLTPGVERTN